jgi:hypothetical protein
MGSSGIKARLAKRQGHKCPCMLVDGCYMTIELIVNSCKHVFPLWRQKGDKILIWQSFNVRVQNTLYSQKLLPLGVEAPYTLIGVGYTSILRWVATLWHTHPSFPHGLCISNSWLPCVLCYVQLHRWETLLKCVIRLSHTSPRPHTSTLLLF